MNPWEAFRLQFPVADRLIYLNHAAVSPLPLRSRDRMERYLEEMTRVGALNYPQRPGEVLLTARTLGAELMGTGPKKVFVVRSTTAGLAVAATGLPAGEGDNVVLVEREFPANIRPWLPLRRRGVELRFVPQREGRVDLDALAEAVDRRTAAVSVSYVQFLSGYRLRPAAVAEICRSHDALFVLDAIQGLGAFPLDVEAEGVDFLSADAHKWLLGPEGVGLGYASPRALERIQPAVEGWLSVQDPFDFFNLEQPLKDTAARYEEGAANLVGVEGMIGSLELLLAQGIERVSERILQLTEHLCEGLARRGWQVLSPRQHPAERSGIVLTSRAEVDFEALQAKLRAEGVVASLRDGALRLAPHAYNTEQELDRLLELL